MEFPAWMYHTQHEARKFESEEEFDAAGAGWVDSPAKLDEGAQDDCGTGDAPLDRDALKARAAELGIEYPRNISTDKLAALVAA